MDSNNDIKTLKGIKTISIAEFREKLSRMRPEEKDHLLSEIIEQLRLVRTNPSMEPFQIEQIDVAIDDLTMVLQSKGLWNI